MGILISPAVVPVTFSLTWADCSASGAIAGSLCGLLCGLLTWIATALNEYGAVNLESLSGQWPMFAGNVVSGGGSALICIGISLLYPQGFDWTDLKAVVAL